MKSKPLSSATLDKRLLAVEARLAAIERDAQRAAAGQPPAASGAAAPAAAATPIDDEAQRFFVLTGLRQQLGPGAGGVAYGGLWRKPDGGELRWQIGRTQADVQTGLDWATLAPRLAALGHPVRLALLQALLAGPQQTTALAALPGLGTTGQLYHHLRELQAANWLHSPQRGVYALRDERLIPLLAVLTAAHS